MEESKNLIPKESDFLLYTTPEGNVKIEVFFQNETVWLTQKRMAELFGVSIATINEHLTNIYKSNELSEDSTIRNFRIVQKEGARAVEREVNFYNLDAIISVGYRVNSTQATHFRIWATQTLRQYIVKGFAIDDERLKQAKTLFGKDYFKELLERVRSIRASERRIYQQITDIFAECSIDYDPRSDITQNFYSMVQNKFHYAITGLTAAEIIYTKADRTKPYMGLSTWKNSPKGRVLKSDTLIAKNYLPEDKIKKLEREFETFLNVNASKIDWWWKNGENKQDYFGIKYEYAGSISTFYPDYLLKLSDGRLGLLEVKDSGDRDGKTYTKAKAEALQKYIADSGNKKLFGGIVVERNRAWLINDSKSFNWEKCEHGEWGEWNTLNL